METKCQLLHSYMGAQLKVSLFSKVIQMGFSKRLSNHQTRTSSWSSLGTQWASWPLPVHQKFWLYQLHCLIHPPSASKSSSGGRMVVRKWKVPSFWPKPEPEGLEWPMFHRTARPHNNGVWNHPMQKISVHRKTVIDINLYSRFFAKDPCKKRGSNKCFCGQYDERKDLLTSVMLEV